MRKIFTLLTVVLASVSYGQSLELVSQDDTIYYDANIAGDDITAHASIKNTSATDKVYKVRVNNVNTGLCGVNYFCWDLCYTPGVLVSSGSLTIPAGTTNSLFTGYIVSAGGGTEGACSLSYTFFNVNDANDTLMVDMTWYATKSISVEEEDALISAVYPNPASDFLNVKLNNVNDGEFQIMNIVGQVVKAEKIENGTSHLTMDVSELNSGVYFYTLILNGQAVETKRMVISK